MSTDILSQLRPIAAETLAVPEERIVPEARFAEDLEADSLDLVELVMAIEETFEVDIDEAELEDITTVAEAVDLVASKLALVAARQG